MQVQFDNFLLLTLTINAKDDFQTGLALDERLLLHLFSRIKIKNLEVHILQGEGTWKMAERLCFYLIDRKYCSYTGICNNPTEHWPDYCSPIGKVIHEIDVFTRTNETSEVCHPSIVALYNHKEAIIRSFNMNHNFHRI